MRWERMLMVKCWLLDGADLYWRWAEYFEQVLSVADVRGANINVVGNWRFRYWES